MNKKVILTIGLISLFGLVVFVSAIQMTKNYSKTSVTAEFIEKNFKFEEGWNLVQGILNPEWIQTNNENIKAIYALNPMTKEYVRFYPHPETNKIEETTYSWTSLAQIGAVWIYSDKEFTSNYWKFETFPLDSIPLFSGWNFIGITPEMKDMKINEIKGNCEFLKFCVYQRQKWDCLSEEGIEMHILADQEQEIGMGLAIKVLDNCKLGITEEVIPSIPQLPQ